MPLRVASERDHSFYVLRAVQNCNEGVAMKVGIFCIQPDAAADPAVVASHAEGLGFASYWVPDHIILPVTYQTKYPANPGDGPDPDYLWKMPDPLIALMRAATATTTLEVGTAILLAAERNPLHLAKEIASLDSYSHGRFHFGIGAGWNREECQMAIFTQPPEYAPQRILGEMKTPRICTGDGLGKAETLGSFSL